MRLAVFSDIHANLEALETVLNDAGAQSVHRWFCLGDIVGYGANPNQCIERIRALPKLNCLLGNHDAAAIWRYSPYAMTKDATQAILWTIDRLSKRNNAYLQQRPSTLAMGNILFSHANPYNPEAYRYVINNKYAQRSFRATREQLLFVSHSHRPMIITRKNMFQTVFFPPTGSLTCDLSRKKRQIINCGSVGQPRDRDPRACYCILDTRQNTIEFRRLEYDYVRTGQKIKEAGLSDYLARRLAKGQ